MKRIWYIALIGTLFIGTTTFSSCNRKAGCPAYETTKVKTKRNGDLKTRRGKSQLFPKKMRRG